MTSTSRITGLAARTSRTIPRSQLRCSRPRVQYRTYADAPSPAAASGGGALVGGLIGGGLVLATGYGYYHFSGVKTAVQSMSTAKAYFDAGKTKIAEKTPEPNEAIEWLHSTALAYAGFIPGAKSYVDAAFKDVESIRAKHGDKVDAIIREGYDELKQVTKQGEMNLETVSKVWNVLQDKFNKIGELAGDAVEDILNNHPDVKKKVGGNIDQLRQLQDQYGPKVKEEVDRTWGQISGIIGKGVTASTATDIQKLVEEKVEKIKELGNQAYKEGLDQVKPYLEKNPKIKELVEKNEDALKSGNLNELWDKVKDAVNSGNTEDFEKYIQSATESAKSQGKKFGVDIDKYLQAIPGSSEIVKKVQQLQDISKKHGPEAEKIFKSTIDEIKQVLQNKTQEAEKVAEKAKKDSQ